MSETENFKSDINRHGVPPSSRATSSVPSNISGNAENPISISDSDSEEDFIPPSAKELAERRRLRFKFNQTTNTRDDLNWRTVKEEPKGNVLPFKSILLHL